MTESKSFIWKEATKQAAIHGQMLETYIKNFIELTGIGIEKLALVEWRREDGRVDYYLEEKEKFNTEVKPIHNLTEQA